VWLSSLALRRCPCPTRDAYDRFLPSAASISSTRASFALDEVTPRTNGILRFRPPRPPCRVCDRAPSGFTPPRWLWRVDVCFFASNRCGLLFHRGHRRPIQCHACRTPRLRRLANPFAAAHTSRVVPRSFRLETREGLATARSDTTSVDEVHFATYALRHLPHVRWCQDRPHANPLGSDGFAATGPRPTPLHRDDAVLISQTRLSRLGPRSRPRIILIAGASLGQTQPLDFCNEFSNTTHEHIVASVVLAHRRGMPCVCCRARCALHAALTILFLMQRWLELVAPQRATHFPRHPGSRPGPRRP